MSTLRTRHRTRSAQGETRPGEGMRPVNPHAAGVDIGAHELVACVPDGDNRQIVRTCGTSTAALQTLADWLIARDIETVAMASTGVSWMPLCAALEARGLHCCLSSAHSIQRVLGRKSDVLDCQWIQTFPSDGLLAASFRPDADLVVLRTLLRHRADKKGLQLHCLPSQPYPPTHWQYCPAKEGIETVILLMAIPPRHGGVGSIALLKQGSKPNTMGPWRGGDDF